jgi:hypothetical protein
MVTPFASTNNERERIYLLNIISGGRRKKERERRDIVLGYSLD